MNNYNTLFYLYLSVVCLLLFVFAIFVSFQIRALFFYFLTFLKILDIDTSNLIFSIKNYQNFYCFYMIAFNYFSSIALSEFYLETILDDLDRKNIYTSLAIAYRELSFVRIAEHYYLKALSLDPFDVQLTLSLTQMYDQLGYKKVAAKLQNDFTRHNPSSR